MFRWLKRFPRQPARRLFKTYQPTIEGLECRELLTGGINLFNVPTASSSPLKITTGPDHNLWVTENTASQIAKITTAGSFTEYSTLTHGSGPYDITTGPDNNLWYTEANLNLAKIAKSTIG
jgi:virginiamycin B lyase